LKSSTGKYYVGLDHIRGIAAFMVFTWHFIHVHDGHRAAPPVFPLSLLTEGHTGVALFMTLSGYLFAKLLTDKRIIFKSFLWNRLLRLAPLMILVVLLAGAKVYITDPKNLALYLKMVKWGFIMPTLPNGGWSITAEFHFYLILPLLLFIRQKSSYLLLGFLLLALLLRLYLYMKLGDVQWHAYFTIIGRIDQFVLGILAFHYRDFFKGKHLVALMVLLCFAAFYFHFDSLGGVYRSPMNNPSINHIWIYLPTIEGLAYASLIAWYDNSFAHSTGRFSRFVALIGTYSYSIYLLHFFFVFGIAELTDEYLIDLSNIYIALLLSPFVFLLMIPIAWASYRFVEMPFLQFRTNYIVSSRAAAESKQPHDTN
jgi:peptidoglycan/LPS O-acetylase OafA/YrhL